MANSFPRRPDRYHPTAGIVDAKRASDKGIPDAGVAYTIDFLGLGG